MRSERINFLAVVTAVAGLTGFIGVYREVVQLLAIQCPVAPRSTIYLDGTVGRDGRDRARGGHRRADCSDAPTCCCRTRQIRRIVALLMVISSIVLLVCSAIGFTRVAETIGAPNPLLPGAEGRRGLEATVGDRTGRSRSLSGIIATVASVLLVARREAGLERSGGPGGRPSDGVAPSSPCG